MAKSEGAGLAVSRDRWLTSDEGLDLADGSTSGQYLRNRLGCAYVAGWHGLAWALQQGEIALADLDVVVHDEPEEEQDDGGDA